MVECRLLSFKIVKFIFVIYDQECINNIKSPSVRICNYSMGLIVQDGMECVTNIEIRYLKI